MTLTTAGAVVAVTAPTNDVRATATAPVTPARVGSWETPDERALKQIYIVRQSSITAALTYAKLLDEPTRVEDILRTAKQFENYVFDAGVAGLTSDDFPE